MFKESKKTLIKTVNSNIQKYSLKCSCNYGIKVGTYLYQNLRDNAFLTRRNVTPSGLPSRIGREERNKSFSLLFIILKKVNQSIPSNALENLPQ